MRGRLEGMDDGVGLSRTGCELDDHPVPELDGFGIVREILEWSDSTDEGTKPVELADGALVRVNGLGAALAVIQRGAQLGDGRLHEADPVLEKLPTFRREIDALGLGRLIVLAA